eukprot:NODE_3450_length_1348_cov_41.182041_g3012_i0.p1 GENE.NODE_3450_length_1348_cov_41.182041_g3012_i0~~NODE_3450_length_1348_cov_41.182041_g3012_i0.p1  ORF type:complete len:150 (+),score=31.91 NODE_3450_length_1348_cov_41.182041_g3012_i0:524-973(+)
MEEWSDFTGTKLMKLPKNKTLAVIKKKVVETTKGLGMKAKGRIDSTAKKIQSNKRIKQCRELTTRLKTNAKGKFVRTTRQAKHKLITGKEKLKSTSEKYERALTSFRSVFFSAVYIGVSLLATFGSFGWYPRSRAAVPGNYNQVLYRKS